MKNKFFKFLGSGFSSKPKVEVTIDVANEIIAQELARSMIQLVTAKALIRARKQTLDRNIARRIFDEPESLITFDYSISINYNAIVAALSPDELARLERNL